MADGVWRVETMNDTAIAITSYGKWSKRRIFFYFLGSMRLAITLLIGFSVAAFIGVILQQNQPYTDYVFSFGPFWFQVFRDLGLYNIFSAPWLIAIFAFLVISTTVCIVRTTPGLLSEMRDFRLNVRSKSLRMMRLNAVYEVGNLKDPAPRIQEILKNHGYRVRGKSESGQITLAAMKGAVNRLGYPLTHIGLVVILLTGVVDGNLPIYLSVWQHHLHPMTHAVPVSQVPAQSILPVGTIAFRGDVTLPVGQSTDAVFFRWGKGYLEQKLPFNIKLNKFTIERYPGGRPKDFVSRITVTDPQTNKTVKGIVSENHPFFFHGIGIYQSSFGDGGSRLKFKLWSLTSGESRPFHGTVFSSSKIPTSRGILKVNFKNFKTTNVSHPFDFHGKGQAPMVDLGPSIKYKVTRPDGQFVTYMTYMRPQWIHHHWFYLTGIRKDPAQPYVFLTIPAGPHKGITLFMGMVAALHNSKMVRKAAEETSQEVASTAHMSEATTLMQAQLAASVSHLIHLFVRGGYVAVNEDIRHKVNGQQSRKVSNALIRVLNLGLENLYAQVLENRGVHQFNQKDLDWLASALPELGVLHKYGTPFYLQMTGYHKIYASGLQATDYPLTPEAFAGSFMLVFGSILMFFMPYRRTWVRLESTGENAWRILIAGTANRHRPEFDREFEKLTSKIEDSFPGMCKGNDDGK